MKRAVTGIVLGTAAGVCGTIVYALTDQQIWGWLTTAVLLGIASQLPRPARGIWPWWGALGGGIIVISWALNQLTPVPIWVAWPLLGTVFGVLCTNARSGVGWRITGGGVGLLAGTLGMGVLPLITLVLLPTLGLPTTFDYDMDMLGLVTTGVFVGGTLAWLGEE